MKQMTLLFALILTLTSFMGCSSTPTVEALYSFAKNDSPSAAINFDSDNPSVSFIDFEGAKLPVPNKGTRWAGSITFPAGEPFKLTVRARYTAPTPMLDIAEGAMEISNFIMTGTELDILTFPIWGPFFVVGTGFLPLALFVDLPMAIALNVNKKVVFECPPLEANRSYTLRMRRKNKKEGATRALMLIDTNSGMVVYEQEF